MCAHRILRYVVWIVHDLVLRWFSRVQWRGGHLVEQSGDIVLYNERLNVCSRKETLGDHV